MSTNLLRQSITLVYAALAVPAMDGNRLKNLAGLQAGRVVLAPDRIAAIYPSAASLVQIDGKRIQLAVQRRDQQVGDVPLWQMAAQCHQLAAAAVIAYGFNYSVEETLADGNVYATIAGMLNPDAQRVKTIMGGDLVRIAFTPVIVFRRGQTLYELSLAPAEEKLMRLNLNVHFEYEGITLPPVEQLEAVYRQEFADFTAVLARLDKGQG